MKFLTLAWIFVGLHVVAMLGAMAGLLVAIPHPDLWAATPGASQFYVWALGNMGTIDILTAAAAMLAWGCGAIGVRKTLLFFVLATCISAAAELTGTKTGWPFGGYAYTGLLGWKIGGRVPYTVPLSWFYMGFAAYVLAVALVERLRLRSVTMSAVVAGAFLLTTWDLVLDPAMASPQLAYMHFWQWFEHGAYFGMPLRNLAGWFATGVAFIGIARLTWRSDLRASTLPLLVPYTIYAINVVWAMALSLSVGLWPTALAAIVFSLVPATLAIGLGDWTPRRARTVSEGAPAP